MPHIESFFVCANFSHCLDQLKLNEYLTVAVSRQYARATTSANMIFRLDQSNNIRNNFLSLLMRLDRVQTDEWNKMIQRVIEAGLVKKWSSDLHGSTQ